MNKINTTNLENYLQLTFGNDAQTTIYKTIAQAFSEIRIAEETAETDLSSANDAVTYLLMLTDAMFAQPDRNN